MYYWQIALRVMSNIRYGSFSVNGTLRVEELPVFPTQIPTRVSQRILPVVCKLSYLATISGIALINLQILLSIQILRN